MLTKLDQLFDLVKNKEIKTVVVAAAEDLHVMEAIQKAIEKKIINAVLVGHKEKIEKIAQSLNFDLTNIEIYPENDPLKSCTKAVELIHDKKASILMKGLVSTAGLLKAVLNKEKGLRKNEVLSHMSVFESPYYHKLLGISDVGMNISPELKDKVAIINNALEVFHAIGVSIPKVAILAAVEVVNPAMPATIDAAALTQMNKRKQITNCIIDGPLGLDNAISKEAALHKGIESEVAGDADILICNDIESGNFMYKAMSFLGGATVAALIMGAQVPIILTSRADSEKSKLMSIVLASAL
ncbi:MAG: bifunctional enoyl-CoA hydratase/phosphate acetyltransferase [Bacteroidetes bacterium]|jgi:phosphate butyryltransferase|nr:bifunctional enoyl-CoA hydratase/phosphate acetyltransferase [Bacteroidota bacterium]MBT3421439.1 bifunctional enoyl-CoA hydratase/phosphate acetyltransferase [Bacteroidota bacterium]MBT4340436.1 bifunctional enoyl-CoA hydratase/phosphate acetyltransferase [Bacteroidota bacterium]MBT4728891.1 bifunctional enoyl-CoA hydratase/phosphate acetyltransferase [Bacteroidota bacterium]MBT4969920.1 bifunctional enoyl-CoA hydratase/phosphate acetyltransferase [Bacteroidota bacterium]